jgi:chemotaxis protein CheD
MGQMAVAKDGQQLRSLLGSCVGVALYDLRHAVGGLAHTVLPDANGSKDFPGKFVDTAIPQLIEEMRVLAGSDVRLVAKLAGGASMFKTQAAIQIGERNVDAATRLLRQMGIPILAQHCGGKQGRKMTLKTSSGGVTIEIVGQQKIEI